MRILLFGKNGQVGWELHRSLQSLGEVIALGRSDADFSKPENLRNIVDQIKPNVIVNAVAYTSVDKAESEESLAQLINSVAAGILAEEAKKIDALFVSYSTDYVFDGSKESEYTEQDIPAPINVYGKSKLDGEKAISSSGSKYLILRTSWVYASRGSNFLLTMMRLGREKNEIKVISDQIGVPTWARYIADVSVHVIKQAQSEMVSGCFKSEILNLTSSGKASWYQFANAIFSHELISTDNSFTQDIKAISTKDYPTVARRPKNSCLSTIRLEERFGVMAPPWESLLELCVEECTKTLK